MPPSWRTWLTWLTPGRDKKARYLSVRFQHPPRLEPDLRLSPHPAQHPEIVLGLCSVTIGADNLDIAYAVCILGNYRAGCTGPRTDVQGPLRLCDSVSFAFHRHPQVHSPVFSVSYLCIRR